MKKNIITVFLAISIVFAKSMNIEKSAPINSKVATAPKSDLKSSRMDKFLTALIGYAYLYESTCGRTFGIVLSKPMYDLTNKEYDDLMDKLEQKNAEICEGYVPEARFV
ncbi:hypothetical protein HZP84_06805 [Elizabethkingia anophelis]|uniref:Uncharacterized protein n=5 Tax=Elizabethkingia anophelis TaxID=1117645 RepID=A0A077ELT3_9FLAO|nr:MULTISPECIES: hypothetical protein [Elizabethkingia]AIL46450.1 hypothetical protein BD94_2675 [Elizabethkingia anophelis NUHP1]AMR41163.1 hypothetical protein A2T74_07220 [Elizabethkingia anophelis]AMX47803.1 hypothetical protein A4C56_07220 [Elizabethkingia anophelis]AMX51260.1 hypothetical protein A2T72_07220 [Elizabethkingia anophelis]AMX54655.1 hypothetical protein A2T59_07220 [Elizabethkingia anophelis]